MENSKIKSLSIITNKKAETGLKGLIITALLIGGFIFAFLSFGAYLSKDNSTNISILQNSKVNESFEDIQSELETSQSSIESQRESFFSDIPVFGEITIVIKSIVGVGNVFGAAVKNMWTITFGLISETLGISPIITGLFTSIVLISIILLAWSVYRAGR